jgi:putative exosortase-associated protein (TIGR04073 family)
MRQSMPNRSKPGHALAGRALVGHLARRGAFRTLLVLGALLLLAGPAAADSSPRKLGRGLANLTTGVIVLPAKVIETTRAHGPFVGATWGLVKGLGWVVATETIGLFEFLTCPFETPPDFKPILQPEFPWGHYQDAEKRKAKAEPKKRSVFTRDR